MSTFQLGPLQTKWIEYLEQHPEQQTTGVLGRIIDGKEMMCCLGIGGVLAGVCKWEDDKLITNNGHSQNTLYNSYSVLGLRSGTGMSLEAQPRLELAVLNDTGKTWPEIAAILRAHPEQYFTHSV